ncbi:MAG: GNAT family N-acetyltransferase, partial [Akkermansiaceae bacterium]|nr:GNAT family N-acetyltransferase [Armatimonadota bacterium]
METAIIRLMQAGDEAAWREMWGAYCAFYAQQLPESVTAGVWSRILDGANPVNSVIALTEDGIPLGFANYVLHPHTWSDKTLCYLEDLY